MVPPGLKGARRRGIDARQGGEGKWGEEKNTSARWLRVRKKWKTDVSTHRERNKDNTLKDKSEEKAAEKNGSEGGRRKAEVRRQSESRDRQKRNNSFSLTVSTEIHKRTAKYNSEIQQWEKLLPLQHRRMEKRKYVLEETHTELAAFWKQLFPHGYG